MKMKYDAPHTAARSGLLVAVCCVAMTVAGCKMQANADSSGNFKPGGETNKPNPDAVPDCYGGTGSGQGQFGGWRNQQRSNTSGRFVADEAPAPATRAFDTLLRHERTSGYGGGGEAPDRC